MDALPLDENLPRTYETLRDFLQGCRWRAGEKKRPQLVSITMPAGPLDPLAVLESIYEEEALHFYLERSDEDFAMAGAESAIEFRPAGQTRFQQSKAFIEETLENTIAIGDPNLPAYGPRFFCSFGFFPDPVKENAFPTSLIFVPVWQVTRSGNHCSATANALVSPDCDIELIAKRIWNAHTKFSAFDYSSAESLPSRAPLSVESVAPEDSEGAFCRSVESALMQIETGDIEKIVLARALDLKANQPFHPLEILNTLRSRYPDCYAFSVANGKGQSYIGASPERLIKLEAKTLTTEALAGSAARGKSAAEDARLGHALLNSEKDRREQGHVLDSIKRRLGQLGIETNHPDEPTLKRLENVQHLKTPISASMPEGTHLLDVLEALHPTPAVGGVPREEACSRIRTLETFERDLYAGPIGWVNSSGEGEFLVNIRSALIDGMQARLYAGVGIVEGSEPQKEFHETELKLQALLANLL